MARLTGRFNLEQVVQTSAQALELWRLTQDYPGVPLYSGGLLDAWPNWALDALRICRDEFAVIRAHVAREEAKDSKKPKGRR